MRDLLFRAWDKEKKCWFIFSNAFIYAKDDVMPNTILRIYFSDNYVVEQYTGFKDKNGKQIFEGDIVRLFFGSNFDVRLSQSGAWKIGDDDLLLWVDFYTPEVIGNIHQNLELLEVKNEMV